jgi:hypothetical protein
LTWVDDQVFAAGGEHVARTWADFSAQTGIRAVLHLSPVSPAQFDGPAPEAFLWMAVSDEPDADHEARLLAGRYIADCVRGGWKVLLHSSLGLHRVRWAYVAFRLIEGQSLQAALRQVEKPPWLAPYRTDLPTWKAFWSEIGGRDPKAKRARRGGVRGHSTRYG